MKVKITNLVFASGRSNGPSRAGLSIEGSNSRGTMVTVDLLDLSSSDLAFLSGALAVAMQSVVRDVRRDVEAYRAEASAVDQP